MDTQITISIVTLLAIIGFVAKELHKAYQTKKNHNPKSGNINDKFLKTYLDGKFALLDQSLGNLKDEIKDGFDRIERKLDASSRN